MKIDTFGDFLLAEINRRGMSAREFARYVGVNHQTINKFLDYGKKDVGYPSVEFVLKLAKATHTDVGIILKLIDPNASNTDFEPSPKAMVLAEQIDQLSEVELQMVEQFIGLLQKASGEKS